MSEMTRQQFCAAMGISESTVRRLEQQGLPFTPVGVRSKRYDLAECKAWLKANQMQTGKTHKAVNPLALAAAGNAFIASCRKVQLRVMPS